MSTSMADDPVAKTAEILGHGPEGSDLLLRLLSWASDEDAGDHSLLVHVDSTTALDDRIHENLQSEGARGAAEKQMLPLVLPLFRVRHSVIPRGGAGQSQTRDRVRTRRRRPRHEHRNTVADSCIEVTSGRHSTHFRHR